MQKLMVAATAASLLTLAACSENQRDPVSTSATGAPLQGAAAALHAPTVTITTFATGLNAPRGLRFGPDGELYVAEGGTGGTTSTVGQCAQVPGAGPYTGGYTARISKIDRHGNRTTVVDNSAGILGGIKLWEGQHLGIRAAGPESTAGSA